MKEVILLVEDTATRRTVRPVVLHQPVNHFWERCHLSADHVWVREWACSGNERALTGQRIFREVLPPPPPEPAENPKHDAIKLKAPLEWE